MTLQPFLDSPLGGLLAAAGALALVFRLCRALLRMGLRVAESTATGGLLEVSIRRGDLTGMAERRAELSRARRGRTRALALSALWAVLLWLPPLAGISRAVYAPAALLWLVPRRRALPGRATPLT